MENIDFCTIFYCNFTSKLSPNYSEITSSFGSNGGSLSDFEPVSEIVHFLPGQVNVHININIKDDEIVENNEEFELSLSNPVNGILGSPTVAKVVIVDDDVEDTGGGSGIYVIYFKIFKLFSSYLFL